MDGVVPIAMTLRACDDDVLHLGVRHFDADRIGASIECGADGQPGRRAHTANELDDGLSIDERPAAPVFGDVAEEAMFDLVPLGGAGWEMRDADGEPGPRGEALQLEFSQPRARTVTAAGIRRDEELARVG